MIWFCLIVLATGGAVSAAEDSPLRGPGLPDLKVATSARSYPVSAIVEAEAGYGIPLWGELNGPMGGYLRPRVRASSVVTYNALDVGIEFYPVGILGFRAGAEAIRSEVKYLSYDCARFDCAGRFTRQYVGMDAVAGKGDYFGTFSWIREFWLSGEVHSALFVEPSTGLALSSGGEVLNKFTFVLGRALAPHWLAMAVLQASQADNGGVARMPLVLFRYHRPETRWALAGGVGSMESSLVPRGITATLFWQQELAVGVGLR